MLSARLRNGVSKRQGKRRCVAAFPAGLPLELDAFDCGVGCAVAAVLG